MPGARLEHFEILGRLGAGGMGVVYRARDTRDAREVALKVLADDARVDVAHVRRFHQEIRVASSLRHPNIVAVLGSGGGANCPYLVSELLEGTTLREACSEGRIDVERALRWGKQLAAGLAAIHDAALVHRDLKPENVIVTRSGQIKILDFGVARDRAGAPPATQVTETGAVIGTAGYMAPEQVRGEPAEAASDVFSFGVVLYELLSGKRLYGEGSALERGYATLSVVPEPLSARSEELPAALDAIVMRCLEKDPRRRFPNARELAFALSLVDPRQAANRQPRKVVHLTRLTYRTGRLGAARFGPTSDMIIHAAEFGGDPPQVYLSLRGRPDARPVTAAWQWLFGVSRTGDMLLAVAKHPDSPVGLPRARLSPILSSRYAAARASFANGVTLARTSLAGGAVRELDEGILAADLSPDGKQLAVARRSAGATRVEFPLHRVIHELDGWVEDLRISPSGREVAFVEHPFLGDDAGVVKLAGLSGGAEAVGDPWETIRGLSWAYGDRGLLITAGNEQRKLLQIDPEGRSHELYDFPPWPVVEDVSASGEVMLTVHMRRLSAVVSSEHEERDLTWFDGTFVVDVSADGSLALLGEGRHAATAIETGFGAHHGFVRSTRERTEPVYLGPGTPWALSPDGRWAVVSRDSGGTGGLTLVPTGSGEARQLPAGRCDHIELVRFFADGTRLLVLASAGGRSRLWVQRLDDGSLTPAAAEGLETSAPPSPDGRRLVVHGPAGWGWLPIGGDSVTPLPGIAEGDEPVAWTPDGDGLFVHRAAPPRAEHQARVDLYRLGQGTMQPWRSVAVSDPVGVASLWQVRVCPATGEILYVYDRELGDLYSLTGLDLG